MLEQDSPGLTPGAGRRHPVPGSTTGRPLLVLLDLLGRRWTLRLLWELRSGPLAFVELRRAAGGVSQSVLTVRLAELRDAGLVDTGVAGYRLTRNGHELVATMSDLDRWAERWAAEVEPT